MTSSEWAREGWQNIHDAARIINGLIRDLSDLEVELMKRKEMKRKEKIEDKHDCQKNCVSTWRYTFCSARTTFYKCRVCGKNYYEAYGLDYQYFGWHEISQESLDYNLLRWGNGVGDLVQLNDGDPSIEEVLGDTITIPITS